MTIYDLNGDGLLIDGCPCDAEKMADEVRGFVEISRPPMKYLYLPDHIHAEMEERGIMSGYDDTFYLWGLEVKRAIRFQEGEEE